MPPETVPIRSAENRSGIGIDQEILSEKLAEKFERDPAMLIVFHLDMIVQDQDVPVWLPETRTLFALKGVGDNIAH